MQDAVDKGEAIAFFEYTNRNMLSMLLFGIVPISVVVHTITEAMFIQVPFPNLFIVPS